MERKAFGGAYLSARYESLKEETDFTVQRYLTGITTLNPGEEELRAKSIDADDMKRVMRDLELERFIEKPVSMLSNGQSRRARIAKALLSGPEMLCLDAPFSKSNCNTKSERKENIINDVISWSGSNCHKAPFQCLASPG